MCINKSGIRRRGVARAETTWTLNLVMFGVFTEQEEKSEQNRCYKGGIRRRGVACAETTWTNYF